MTKILMVVNSKSTKLVHVESVVLVVAVAVAMAVVVAVAVAVAMVAVAMVAVTQNGKSFADLVNIKNKIYYTFFAKS